MAFATINKGASYFNTVTYTGTGTTGGNTLSVTGVNFKPDLVWVKNRTVSVNHYLNDIIRGTGSGTTLHSNGTNSEATASAYADNGGISAFSSDGFSAYRGTDNTYQGTNLNGNNYVSWNWLASNTTASNTNGSITSTVSANTTSGFSIVSYTGTGANATVGHGLGVVPKMMIFKNRTVVSNWATYHASIATPQTNVLYLNLTDASSANAAQFNSTAPTSSLFSVGTSTDTNGSTRSMIAYCFAEVKGFSKFGSYTGNGSTDGPFIYTGFKPAFVFMKKTSAIGQWYIWDNKRNTYNVMNLALHPNTNDTDQSYGTDGIDILSNGFKLKSVYTYLNASSATYIYMAFAENPFVLTDGTPVTAR